MELLSVPESVCRTQEGTGLDDAAESDSPPAAPAAPAAHPPPPLEPMMVRAVTSRTCSPRSRSALPGPSRTA